MPKSQSNEALNIYLFVCFFLGKVWKDFTWNWIHENKKEMAAVIWDRETIW